MGGTNPYQTTSEIPLPTQKFRVTFMPMEVTLEVDPADLPFDRDGRPGSILDLAGRAGVEIDHACGGVCACSTCHVIVREGFATLHAATDDEEDMLDQAPGLEITSRLACQAVPNGSQDLVVEVPGWNRNHAREEPH